MGTKREIPSVPKSAVGTDRAPFDMAVKEDLEILMGRRGTPISPLQLTASLEDAARKINEIIGRLQ